MKNELGNMDNQGTKNKCFLSRDEILTNIYYLQPLTYNNKKVLTTSQLVGVYIYKWNGLTNYASSSYFWTESGVMLLAEILSNANCIGRYHRMNSKNYNMKYSDICQYLIEKYFQSDDVADVYKDMINAEYSNNNKNYETDLTDLSVKDVDLFGDTVVAAQDKDGMIWAGVRWICEGLGLSDGQTKNERLRIQEDLVLSQGGGRNLILPTNGGNQETLCLKLEFVPLWLAKISITPNMKENNPELVEKLVKYQLVVWIW